MINPVKGTHDIIGSDAALYNFIEAYFRTYVGLCGFEDIKTPIIEHTPLFIRSVGESSDIVNKEMYTFLDKGGRSITLRPELTAGVMRSIVSNKLFATNDLPMKFCYFGPCFRYERPQTGRFRQFHQLGIEIVGAKSYLDDVEAISTGYYSLVPLGIDDIKVKINSLGDEESRQAYKKALKEYFQDKIENMCEDCKRRFEVNPLRILDCKVPSDIEIVKNAPKMSDYLTDEAKHHLELVLNQLDNIGIPYEIDENLVRGLDYYTGIVFEFHYDGLSEIGAIGGGGHYKNLLKEVGGPDLEGVGFSCGVERIEAVLKSHPDFTPPYRSLDFYVMAIGDNGVNIAYKSMMELRLNGYSCEMNTENKSFKALFKTALRKNAKFAIIIGDDEIQSGEITIKNLKTQTQTLAKIDSLVDVARSLHFDYLQDEKNGGSSENE